MSIYRPRFSDYKTDHEHKREQEQVSQSFQEKIEANRRAQKLKSYRLITANLPLLKAHVAPSPVNVTSSEPWWWKFLNNYSEGLTSGWPVGTIEFHWHESHSVASDGSRTDYFVVTGDGRFGQAIANRKRHLYSMHDPLDFNAENFIKYRTYTSWNSRSEISADNVRSTLRAVLESAGLEADTLRDPDN